MLVAKTATLGAEITKASLSAVAVVRPRAGACKEDDRFTLTSNSY